MLMKSLVEIKILFLFNLVLSSCCINIFKNDNVINIKVKVVDNKTKLPRVNDSVFAYMIAPNFPMREYIEKSAGVTDSLGEFNFKIIKTQGYRFKSKGIADNFCGTVEFEKCELKNNNVVLIETSMCGGVKRILDSLR